MTEPSCREWLRRLNRGECSAKELASHYLTRIDSVNPLLNAVVAHEPDRVICEADAADRRRRSGDHGVVLGLPVTIKDSLEVSGAVSAGGSFAREGYRPKRDATVVARLRAAGAIVLGKTNVPEYCWAAETDNAIYGRTNNPRDPERTPGGSSGGEAAILGADASPAGIGSDGGGSIRIPSHYCGVVGLRPTVGRTPETGHWGATRDTGMQDMNCVGPMGRFVDDLALLLPIVAGPDGIDPFALPVALGDSSTVDPRSLRVGFYVHDGVEVVSSETQAAVKTAAGALAERGAKVSEIVPPIADEATGLFFAAMAADGGAKARDDVAAAGGRHHAQMSWLLEDVRRLAVSAAEFFELQRRIFDFRRQMRTLLSQYDIVICPVTTRAAPVHGQWGGSTAEETYRALNYTHVYSLSGLPVVSVPAARENGLPVGIQVVAQAWQDHVALAAASVIEGALGGFSAGAPD